MNDGAGYKIPAVIDPGSARCIRVYVPDDPDYLAAFWGALSYMGRWVAWERDSDKKGKLAAAVWRRWIDISRNQYELLGGCDLPLPDPVYPETDGIEEIDDALWYWLTIIQQVVDLLDSESPYTLEIVADSVMGQIGYDLTGGIAALVDYFEPMTPAERAAEIAAIDWQDMRDKVYCELPAKYTDHDHWLDQVSSAIFAWLNETAGDIYDALQTMSDWMIDTLSGRWIGSFANADPGGGAGFGFSDPACTFFHEWDFTTSAGAFDWKYISDYDAGSWVSGVGFEEGKKHTASWHRSIGIMLPFFPTRVISRWEFDVTVEKGHFDSPSSTYGYYSVLYYNGSARSGYLIVSVAGNMNDGTYTIGSNHTQACNGIYMRGLAAQGNLESEAEAGTFIITGCRVWGAGTDPFI